MSLVLEYEAAFTGSVRQTLNSSVEKVTATIKADGGDTLSESTLRDGLADDRCGFDSGLAFALCGKFLVVGCGSAKGLALLVIDHLYVNLLVAAEYDHTRTLGSSVDMLTYTVVNPSSSFNSVECHNSILLLFCGRCLARLATKLLTDELDTFTLIRLRLTE